MSTVIFQISRSRFSASTASLVQLRLKERYNEQRDQVTAMATLHLDKLFLDGMHYCYVDEKGEKFFSFNKAEGVDFKVNFKINFEESQLEGLVSQIQTLGDVLAKPSLDENGVSQLRGYQLHIKLIPEAKLGISKKEDDVYGSRLQQKVSPSDIAEVKIVSSKDPEYVNAPDSQTIDGDLLIRSLYEATKKEVEVEQTPESIKASVLSLMSKSKQRGANRQAARASQEVRVDPKSTAKPIVLKEDDDEQPE